MFLSFAIGKLTSRLLVRTTPCLHMIYLHQERFAHQKASVKRLFLHGRTHCLVIHPAVEQLKMVLHWSYCHSHLSTPTTHQNLQ